MGEVYLADDTKLKRPVALKRLATHLQGDEHYRGRLLREAENASRLNHPHVAAIYDVLEESGETFLVMEYVEGQTLRDRLTRPMPIDEFLEMAVGCAEALVAAHERGVVHRDIKPENIMLTKAGQVKILDFGVAKRVFRSEELTTQETLPSTTAGISGTPPYMAPEVLLEKEADGRSDIFSLGVAFYEALTGRHPFRANTRLETYHRILYELPEPVSKINSEVPSALEGIIAKMLEKDPSRRSATAADLLVDLRAVQRAAGQKAAWPVPRPMPAKWHRAVLPLALALLALASVLVAVPSVRQRLKQWWGSEAITQPRNLVVLPFRSVNEDKESIASAQGLTETLTTKLTTLTATHRIQIVPASQVRARRVLSAEDARKVFGAQSVIEGTLERYGGQVRVNYALVDTTSLRPISADVKTGEVSDLFAFQNQVVNAVLEMLDLKLEPRERQALLTRGTHVVDVYDLYLQGRGYLLNYDKAENIENAINVFQRALALDPNYALAHTGLGEAYWRKYYASKESQWLEKAQQECEMALKLDANLSPAHILLGTLRTERGLYAEAVAEFRRALAIEPTNDDVYGGLALAYERLGKLDQAESTYQQAIKLRPNYWAGYQWLGKFYFNRARYPEAAEMFSQVVALVPDSYWGHLSLGGTLTAQGRYAEAIDTLKRSVAIRSTDFGLSNLATAYFYLHQFDEAARTYEEAVKLKSQDYRVWGNLAEAYYWTEGKRADAPATFRKAIALAQEGLRVNPRDPVVLGNLAFYHAMLGKRRPALDYLARALRVAPNDAESRYKAALVYQHLGKTEEALTWLKKALEANYSPHVIRNQPAFDALRSDPRFPKLDSGR